MTVMTQVAPDPVTGRRVAARVVDGLGWAARAVRVPLADEVAGYGVGLIARQPAALAPVVAADLPVLIIGGLASNPATLAPLTDWLTQLGCRPQVAPIRAGFDCGERTMPAIHESLAQMRHEYGVPPVVVAHSRGGQFARAAAVRDPDSVAALITLGSPINRLLGVHPLLRLELTLLSVAGAVGVPGMFRPSCLWGACCRRLRDDLLAPFPRSVPYVSVYSRRDSVVDWRSSLDPAARHREVDSSHIGLINSAEALDVVGHEIARCSRGEDRRREMTTPSAA